MVIRGLLLLFVVAALTGGCGSRKKQVARSHEVSSNYQQHADSSRLNREVAVASMDVVNHTGSTTSKLWGVTGEISPHGELIIAIDSMITQAQQKILNVKGTAASIKTDSTSQASVSSHEAAERDIMNKEVETKGKLPGWMWVAIIIIGLAVLTAGFLRIKSFLKPF